VVLRWLSDAAGHEQPSRPLAFACIHHLTGAPLAEVSRAIGLWEGFGEPGGLSDDEMNEVVARLAARHL
jgi:hypothetical protein